MTTLELFLLPLLVIFVGISGGLLYLALRAGARIRNLEFLFEDTLEEMTTAAEIFHTLTKRITLLTDHPDIQSLSQVMLLILDILERYVRDGKYITSTSTQEERKE